MLKSMNSLPSTSHTCESLPRCKYFGATPATYCPGPLASVWVWPGINPVARAYHSSERAITGSDRPTEATLDMDMTLPFLARGERRGDASRELLPRKAF